MQAKKEDGHQCSCSQANSCSWYAKQWPSTAANLESASTKHVWKTIRTYFIRHVVFIEIIFCTKEINFLFCLMCGYGKRTFHSCAQIVQDYALRKKTSTLCGAEKWNISGESGHTWWRQGFNKKMCKFDWMSWLMVINGPIVWWNPSHPHNENPSKN